MGMKSLLAKSLMCVIAAASISGYAGDAADNSRSNALEDTLVAKMTGNPGLTLASPIAGLSYTSNIMAIEPPWRTRRFYSMEDGFGITRIRAALMQEATEKTDAVMDAVLKLQDATVEKLAAQYRSIYPVNYNSPGQVVVAAARNEVEAFEESVRASGGRTMRLRVSGGFHSPFMSTAADRFLEQLDAFSFSDPSIPVWSNVSGRKYEGNIKAALALQIKSPVRWVDIVEDMIRCGVTCFIEIGPGSTLTGLIRRISRNVKTYNAGTVEGVIRILEEVRNV